MREVINRNGVEDAIESLDPASTYNVLLSLNACPTPEDLARLGQSGTVGFVGQYLSVVQLTGVTVEQAVALGSDPLVAKVELERMVEPALNTTVPELLVRSSPLYSPYTLEDTVPWIKGYGVNIAILDTGTDDDLHESLPPAVGWYNAFTDSEAVNPGDVHGHGTHMAGVALGRGRVSQPGDLRGVAPGAGLVDMRICQVLKECPEVQIMRSIERAISRRFEWNIKVLYIGFTSGIRSNGQDTLSQMINTAVVNGLVAVVPAGNSGRQLIGRMAAADYAITVGATDDVKTVYRDDDTVATFSARGPRTNDGDPWLDERKPEVVAPGRLVIAPRNDYVSFYTTKNGTSIAAAHVAGLAALVIQAHPWLTPLQVKDWIIYSAAVHRGGTWDIGFGYGLVDAYTAVLAVE